MTRRFRYAVAGCLAAATMLGAYAVGTDGSASAATGASGLYGYSIQDQKDFSTYVKLASTGGSRTLRMVVPWASVQPTKSAYNWSFFDATVGIAADDHQRMLLVVGQSPSWASGVSTSLPNWEWYPPKDPSTYGTFVHAVLLRYGATGSYWTSHPSVPKSPVVGIEVWNEPNLKDFWESGPNPSAYAKLVIAAYNATRTTPQVAPIVAGSLAPIGGYNDANCDGTGDGGVSSRGVNQVNFVERMYAAGAHGYFDALSVHPYNFWRNATAAQMLTYNKCSAWSEMYQTPVNIRRLMAAQGDGAKKTWITEAGAPTCVARATYQCVSEAEQAKLATAEVAAWKSCAWAGNYYWYDLRDDSSTSPTWFSDQEHHFGVAHANNAHKPVWQALKTAFG
ncbi:hypothetical protein Back2_22670 [Nocardioides baekrokdamisoli]|uniref:Glycoside hydrolase family 5 domain-containing protein n=1 Tax=Nocardioides baekrokdamisoli TaxID=1804624 RepID=A0A3G9IG00_9ACTN|nr:hypothetical protein [Nocardioides baekrokdamisoli]BBH17980.1 hypothetical protein Back2_22670 [Nocardioides baekrokdamisoli]